MPQLDAIGILTKLDRNALARYCIVYSKWRKAEEWLDKAGLVQVVSGGKDETKTMKEWAQSAMSDRYHDQLSKLEIQFGLTPSARARFAANGLTRRDGETRGRKAQTEDDKFFAYGS